MNNTITINSLNLAGAPNLQRAAEPINSDNSNQNFAVAEELSKKIDGLNVIDDYIPQDFDESKSSIVFLEPTDASQKTTSYVKGIGNIYSVVSDSSNSLSDYGWKVYDYIEESIGLREDGEYDPKWTDNENQQQRNPICAECIKEANKTSHQKGNHMSLEYIQEIFGDLTKSYRPCSLCSHTFCYKHCSYRRKLSSKEGQGDARLKGSHQAGPSPSINPAKTQEADSAENSEKSRVKKPDLLISVTTKDEDSDGNWVHVCKKCFEKGRQQTLGATRNLSSVFVSKRAHKNNVVEAKEEKILNGLSKMSQMAFKEQQLQLQSDKNSNNGFSLWNLSTTMISTTLNDYLPANNTATECYLCSSKFTLWSKQQNCQLCNSACCSSCREYSVPLAKSIINPNAQSEVNGDAKICRNCFQLLQHKKKKILFKQQFCPPSSEDSPNYTNHPTPFLIHEYFVFLSSLRSELDKLLWEYVDMKKSLEATTTIIKQFQIVKKKNQRKSQNENSDDSDQDEKEQQLSSSVISAPPSKSSGMKSPRNRSKSFTLAQVKQIRSMTGTHPPVDSKSQTLQAKRMRSITERGAHGPALSSSPPASSYRDADADQDPDTIEQTLEEFSVPLKEKCQKKLDKMIEMFHGYKEGFEKLEKMMPTKSKRDVQLLKNLKAAFEQSHINQFLQAETSGKNSNAEKKV